MEELIQKTTELIRPLCEMRQIHLVEIQLRGEGRSRVLSVFVDTDTGITLQEITELTREISDLLDIHDLIPGRYRLEVSSPGVDRPLTELWQFKKNVGRHLKVEYWDDEGVPHTVRGVLAQVSPEAIVLQSQKEEWRIPMQNIKKAKIQIKF
ncbi:MAG: ribosome maturation factor RimP [Calditrichaeota bacterium]|nr:MAG: ribosome maturation factor RimP [Calditrichota bacterium]